MGEQDLDAYALMIRLPRQPKEYYQKKLGLITFPEDIEQLGIVVERSEKGCMDDERSMTEASKYTQLIQQCSSLRSFEFSVCEQQHFLDYSDLLFYSLESRSLEELSLSLTGIAKSKDTLAKILKSVKTSKKSIKNLTLNFNNIFLNEDTFIQLLLLIKNSPLKQLSITLQLNHFIQLEKVYLLLKVLESAENLSNLTIKLSNMRLLSGIQFPLEGKGHLKKLELDASEAQLFDNSMITLLIQNNSTTLTDVSLKVNASNSLEDVFTTLYKLPNLYILSFTCTRYLAEEQYKMIKNFLSKKATLMRVTITLDQQIDIFYDKSTRIFTNLPNLCSFKEHSSVKLRNKEPLKRMLQYFISKYLTFRSNYIYSLLAIKNMRKNNKKLFPRAVWEDILNDFVTFENLEQLMDKEMIQKQSAISQ